MKKYKNGKGISNNSHTSSPPTDLYEIPHIHGSHCLRTPTIYIYIIQIGEFIVI